MGRIGNFLACAIFVMRSPQEKRERHLLRCLSFVHNNVAVLRAVYVLMVSLSKSDTSTLSTPSE